MLCILLVIELSLVSSHLFTSEDDANRRYKDDFNQLTNEILLYMKRTQYTKPWGPSWTITPFYTPERIGRNRGSYMLFPGQRPESDIDTEIEDYKQGLDPTYQKKTRTSKLTSEVQPVTTLSTSTPTTVTTESTTETTLTTTTTTEGPVAHELNEYIEKKNVGMFSAFTVKFMKIITAKKSAEVKPLFDIFGQYVDAILRDGRVNRLPDQNMALEVLQYLESLNIFLKYGKPEDVQLRAALFLKLVEDEHEDVLKNEYSVYYFVDKYFDSNDAPGMLKAIEDIEEYPGNGMSATHVAGELMSIALLPLQRLAGRQGYGGIKQRAHTDVSISNPKENIIDINEAKVLKNDWNYNKDSNFGLFGNTISNFNSLNGATNSFEHVSAADNFANINKDTEKSEVNRGIFKSIKVDGENVIKNHNYSKENLKNRYGVNKVRSEDLTESNKEYNTKVSKEFKDKEADKINQRKLTSASRIKQVNEKVKGRRKMLHTIDDLEQDKRRNIMKKEQKHRAEKWNHRLRYNSHKSSIKTETDRYKRKLFKKSEDTTQHKTIRSNDLFLTTRNTRRKDNRIEKTNKSNIKGNTSKKISIRAIKDKLFDLLKRKDARKFFTTTTRKGLRLVSSESDEEIVLRKNIYKAIGVHNDFDKVKVT